MKSGGANTATRTSFGQVTRNLRSYLRQVYHLLLDVYHRFTADVVKILLASGASLTCQAVALLVLYAYLHALQHSGQLLGLASRDSALLFLLVAAATLLLLVTHALLEYRASSAILRLCRLYQSEGTQEAIAVCSALPQWFAEDDGSRISIRHLRQLLSIDVNHRSRLVRLVLMSIIPTARLVLCTAALFWLNPEFSAVLLVAAGLPVLGLYSVGRKVADSITIRETASPPPFPQQRQLLHDSWQQSTPLSPGKISWEVALGKPDSRYRQYFRRLRAKILGDFLINSANTVGIAVLVVALGLWMLQEQQGNWSLWLTYLVVLRYFLASLRSFAQLLVRSTRFLRQTQRFTEFMAAAKLAVAMPNPAVAPCPQHILSAYQGGSNKRGEGEDVEDDFDDD
jgi:hypothetical protein